MRVVRETDVGDAGDGHQNGRAEQREAARPPAGIPIPALAEDVIQRRTSKSTVTCRHHDTSDPVPQTLALHNVHYRRTGERGSTTGALCVPSHGSWRISLILANDLAEGCSAAMIL